MALEDAARSLQREFPEAVAGYQVMMMLMEHSPQAKARALAEEMIKGDAPAGFKLWAEGFLHRMDQMGKPVTLQFEALDGRKADLAQMRNQVVLVEFWRTGCALCVAALPRVKDVYATFHSQGFEIIGLTCDTDKERLLRFVEQQGISWPQYFEGKRTRSENTMTQRFGVNGIPHMFLVDKEGCLRADNVRATGSLGEQVAALLAD